MAAEPGTRRIALLIGRDVAQKALKLGAPVVDVDHQAIGSMAAEHFLERGFRHFGFFGSPQAWYSQVRETAFCERLASVGSTVASCYASYFSYYASYLRKPPRRNEWRTTDLRTSQWLQELPKPVAIFAVDDGPARKLADLCRLSNLRAPEEVALLGVDNDEMECHFAVPPLSSVAVPSQQIGFEAAKLLDRMMDGELVSSVPVLLPPIGVVVRHSTDAFAVEDPDVAAALNFIRTHAAESIRIGMVAYAAGTARRTLEAKFRALLGRSVLEEIHRVRVEMAKRLLIATELPMPAIAKRTGFANAQRLAIVFGHAVGMSPTDYRRQTQIPTRVRR